jgi:hypothetical protein
MVDGRRRVGIVYGFCWAEVEAEAKAFGLDFETYVPLAAKEGKA